MLFRRFSASGPHRRARAGFTLIELAIVLTIISIIVGGGLSIFADRLQAGRVQETRARLDRVEDALRNYVQTFGSLPCPARGDVGIDQTTGSATLFGRQDCNPLLANAYPSANYYLTLSNAACTNRYMLVGTVPTRTLNIPDAYAFDGWNDRFMYVVDTNYANGCWDTGNTSTNAAGIQIIDANGAEKTNCGGDCPASASSAGARAIYVLYSYGSNNYGAWRDKAKIGDARNSSANVGTINGSLEDLNAKVVYGAADLPFTSTFREATILYSDTATTYFDDFVRWKTAYQF